MMFLLRTALWTSVVLALLPSFVATKPAMVPVEVGAAQAVAAASAAVADVGGLCERQPEACSAGSQLAAAFGQRTQAGARIVYDFLGERFANLDRTRPTPGAGSNAATAGAEGSVDEAKSDVRPVVAADTLSAADRTPPWHGPPPRHQSRRPS